MIDSNDEQQQTSDEVNAEQLVRNNIGWMLVVAERILGERALAEDAVQEAFLSAFQGLDKFENRSSLKTWLHRITVNTALMKIRKLKRLAEQPVDEYLSEFDQNECRVEFNWSHLASTANIVANNEASEQIHAAIKKLPDAYRIVLLLRDIEGYTTDEVVQRLGISESNVKVRLHRGRAALKNLIEPLLRDEGL